MNKNKLPKGWDWVKIIDVSEINPKLSNKNQLPKEMEVQFLPMKLVEATINKIHLTETKKISEVFKGSYTPFIDGDVIFAKVTPCMENGKIAIANKLKNGVGFGSSEFHIVRAKEQILNKFLFHYIVQDRFRNEAANEMTGAVGLRRVPKQFIENSLIPLPPLETQQIIVSKIEELFSELDKGIEDLKTAQLQLKTYRQSVLKWAFEGKKKAPIGQLFDFVGGGTPSKQVPNYWVGDIPWASVKDVKRDYLNDTVDRISEEGLKNSSANIANKDEVILITRISPGKAIITNIRTAINQDLKVVKPKFETTSKFIFYVFQAIEKECVKKSNGTTVLGINLTSLKEIQVPNLKIEEQNLIVQEIESRLSVADKMEENITQSLQQAEALRQSILKKAFSGELV